MSIVFTQILVILLYILIGFIAGKARLIDSEQRKFLTGLCTNLILPFTVLSAAVQSISRREMLSLMLALLLMFCLFGMTTVISLLYHRVRHTSIPERAVTTSLVTYPNCTFLGLPLCQALFGQIAVLYSAVVMVAFNVLFFSVQSSLFTGKKFNVRNLLTAPMISTVILIFMLIMGIQFPDPVQTVVSTTGAMITPLSLIIIGVMMSENKLVAILKEKRAYLVTFIRNILIPLVALALLYLMPIDGSSKLCILVYISCPCATLTSIYAIRNDMEPELAARSVLMSTLFFSISLPLIIFLGQQLLG